jgi:hypothetical protein
MDATLQKMFPLVAVASLLGAMAACSSATRTSTGFGDAPPPEGADAGTFEDDASGGGGAIVGTDAALTEDGSCASTVTKAQRAEVDFIVVIDTSGSMDEETAQVKTNINAFAAKIGQSGLDYQVILIAEKPEKPPFPVPFPLPGLCIPPPLGGANCTDNPPLYHQVDEAVASTDSLSKILSTYDAHWKQWARPNATKVFIEITDDNSEMLHTAFDQQLLAKTPAGMFGTAASRKYIFDSICGWQDGTPILGGSTCSTAVNDGAEYQHLAQISGGLVDSVCKQSYAGVFDNLATGLVTKLGCEFAMPKAAGGTPVDPTKVSVDYTAGTAPAKRLTQVTDASKCAAVTDGWYYDNNAAPTKLVFCPTLCTTAGTNTSGKVEILLGCKAPAPK